MERPSVTRLRYVSAKKASELVFAVAALGARIEIKGAPVWDGKKWFLWFIPGDANQDIQSQDL